MFIRWSCLVLLTLGCASVATASSNSMLALSPDGKTLLTANRDNGTVTVVDVGRRTAVREIAVGQTPESVAWVGAGPLAAAAVYKDSKVVVFDAAKGQVVREIQTPVEPYGVVVARDGKLAYVTCEYPGVVCELDLQEGKLVREIPVGPFVRGIAFTPDQSRLLVTHYYSGQVSAIDRGSAKVVDRWQGTSADNLARQICVHPEFAYAYVPHIRSRIERAHGSGSIFPFITVVDLVDPEEKDTRRHPIPMDSFVSVVVTANPWEIALSPDGRRLYCIFAGTNDIVIADVLNDDYRYLTPANRILPVGRNPRAVCVSPDGKQVFVYNTLDFSVAIHNAEPFRKIADVKVCDNPFPKDVYEGKVLFNLADQPMSLRKWISCSSCHPDGDHDGRTWQNPEGLRRTTHFFGMSRTYPIHWSADRDELQDFEHTIRGPLMQGRGLISGDVFDSLAEPNSGRSRALDALAAYCNSFEHVLSPHAAGPGKLTPAAERGKVVFFSEETKCATCHSGPDFTDRQMHDVGTGANDPSEKMGTRYDTPTLLRAYRNTAYFHDGSAATLRDVLTTANKGDRHGKTSHLSPTEIDDLIEFLKSLPYELPVSSTPTSKEGSQ